MPDSTAILAMLAAVSMKVLLLAALGALAALALRRSSAACRHLLWTTVLAGVFLISLSAPLPGSWSFPFASIPLPRSIRPDDATPILGTPEQPAQVTPYAARARSDDAAAQGRRRALVADLLVLLWIRGVGIFALRRVAGQVALWRLAADARTIEAGPAGVLLRRMAGPTGIGRRVRLIETGALPMPATWGLFRPVVAMPVEATTWPECRLVSRVRNHVNVAPLSR